MVSPLMHSHSSVGRKGSIETDVIERNSLHRKVGHRIQYDIHVPCTVSETVYVSEPCHKGSFGAKGCPSRIVNIC